MSVPIEDYAIVGDLHTVALVSKGGSIDWLCLPHFDSDATFAALLGTEDHGRWKLAPVEKVDAVSRNYRPDTLVLETEMATPSGTIRIIDFMPTRDAHPVLIRIVEGLEGSVEIKSELRFRFNYGQTKPYVRMLDMGLHVIAGPDGVLVHSPAETTLEDDQIVCDLTVKPGDRFAFQITWHRSWEEPPKQQDPDNALAMCTAMWRGWAESCTHESPYREAVVRSLITLKSLTYQPTGGIIAAATTSLPEQMGGERNWDYRYCWLRDASVTLAALNREGYTQEAKHWRDWLLRAVAGDPEQIQIMYGISGERRLDEYTIDGLPGYANSSPVRIGNAAAGQFQLDVYGEVMGAFQFGRESGIQANEEGWALQQALVEFVESNWNKPDDGIWEVRGDRKHFVYSKVMAWLAAKSAASACRDYGMPGDPKRWDKLATKIHKDVCEKGLDKERGCFTQAYGTNAMDASLLLMVIVGFLPPDDPRMVATVREVQKELSTNGFVLRYRTDATDDGLTGEEGSFVICSFWLVEALAVIGEHDEARVMFERILDVRNDVGLLSEEYDAKGHQMLGNMPQAFSHVGLINAAAAVAAGITNK